MIKTNGINSKHFKRLEFACNCGCGFDVVDVELLEVLEDLRKHFGSPVHINSACRCETHNRNEGGTPKSQHLLGKACDITVEGVRAVDVHAYLDNKYPTTYGLGSYTNFTHIDVRSSIARWYYA